MDDDFVTPENGRILRAMTEEAFQASLARLGKDVPKNPVKFDDGTLYGDCGRQIERRMFWFFHLDDMTMCKCEEGLVG